MTGSSAVKDRTGDQKRRVLPRSEQETIITRMADEDDWQVYSCDRVVKARLLKLAAQHSLEVHRVDEYGIEVMVPRKWVRIKRPRLVSEEERERRRQRARERGLGVKRQRLPLSAGA